MDEQQKSVGNRQTNGSTLHMVTRHCIVHIFMVGILAWTGCTGGSGTPSGRIDAEISVIATSDGRAHVQSFFHDGAAPFVLTDGLDTAFYRDNTSEIRLEPTMLPGLYDASVPYSGEFGNGVFVDLRRSVDGGGSANFVSMIPGFSLTSAAAGKALSRAADELPIQWTLSEQELGTNLTWYLSGPCLVPQQGSFRDTDHLLMLAKGTIRACTGHESETCNAKITVVRSITAYVSGFAKTSQALELQERTFTFQSTP